MKNLSLSGSLLAALLLAPATVSLASASTVAIPATADATPAAPAASRELALVVVESLGRRTTGFDDFDRIDLAFQEVAKQRKWPLKLKAERFAANLPNYELELRLFYQGIRDEMPGELSFRAWVTFTDNSGKKDFGIVRYTYQRRLGEQHEDLLERLFRGAANAIADKVEPVLFPKSAAPKS